MIRRTPYLLQFHSNLCPHSETSRTLVCLSKHCEITNLCVDCLSSHLIQHKDDSDDQELYELKTATLPELISKLESKLDLKGPEELEEEYRQCLSEFQKSNELLENALNQLEEKAIKAIEDEFASLLHQLEDDENQIDQRLQSIKQMYSEFQLKQEPSNSKENLNLSNSRAKEESFGIGVDRKQINTNMIECIQFIDQSKTKFERKLEERNQNRLKQESGVHQIENQHYIVINNTTEFPQMKKKYLCKPLDIPPEVKCQTEIINQVIPHLLPEASKAQISFDQTAELKHFAIRDWAFLKSYHYLLMTENCGEYADPFTDPNNPCLWVIHKEVREFDRHYRIYKFSCKTFDIVYHIRIQDQYCKNMNFAFCRHLLMCGYNSVNYPPNLLNDNDPSKDLELLSYHVSNLGAIDLPKRPRYAYHSVFGTPYIFVTYDKKFSLLRVNKTFFDLLYTHDDEVGIVWEVRIIDDFEFVIFVGADGLFLFNYITLELFNLVEEYFSSIDILRIDYTHFLVATAANRLIIVNELSLEDCKHPKVEQKFSYRKYESPLFRKILFLSHRYLLFGYSNYIMYFDLANENSGQVGFPYKMKLFFVNREYGNFFFLDSIENQLWIYKLADVLEAVEAHSERMSRRGKEIIQAN